MLIYKNICLAKKAEFEDLKWCSMQNNFDEEVVVAMPDEPNVLKISPR